MSIFFGVTNMFYAELIVPIFNKLKPLEADLSEIKSRPIQKGGIFSK